MPGVEMLYTSTHCVNAVCLCVQVYFGSTMYLRFDLSALMLTLVAAGNFLVYFVINSWAEDFFEWKYVPKVNWSMVSS